MTTIRELVDLGDLINQIPRASTINTPGPGRRNKGGRRKPHQRPCGQHGLATVQRADGTWLCPVCGSPGLTEREHAALLMERTKRLGGRPMR
jgi:hypothetical protein